MEKDIIDTNSILFKLYSDRKIRAGDCWDEEEVLEQPVDICSYFRNIFLQVGHLFFVEFLAKFLFVLLITFLVITPIVSIGFWLFTDNPFIIWFGILGQIFMVIDFALLVVGLLGVIAFTLEFLKKQIGASIPDGSRVMSNYGAVVSWSKSVHGKFCVPLQFNQKSKLSDDDN